MEISTLPSGRNLDQIGRVLIIKPMRLFYILILSCFLVGCGNEYGIKKGTKVTVSVQGSSSGVEDVRMHKVTDETLIVVTADGRKLSIPKRLVRAVIEAE